MAETEYLIEFRQVGNVVKVSAVCPITLKEVSIIGDPKMSKDSLINAAVQKLQYVLAKDV